MRALDFRQNIRILVLFLIVQFGGLLLATLLYNGTTLQEVNSSQQSVSTINLLLTYAGFLIILAALMLFLIKKGSLGKVLLLLEAAVILFSSYVLFLFLILLASYYLQIQILGNTLFQLVVPGMLAVLVLVLKKKIPRLRNPVTVLSCIAIGAAVGLGIAFPTALLLMFIIAIYDFVAVFITKHMVSLGQAAVELNLALLVMTNDGEAIPHGSVTKEESKIFSKQKAQLEKNYRSTMTELKSENLVPIIRPRALGNGDLALPLMVSISAYSQFLNFTVSIVISLGATLGLVLTFYILDKYKRPLPAIPPLLFGIAIALALYMLL